MVVAWKLLLISNYKDLVVLRYKTGVDNTSTVANQTISAFHAFFSNYSQKVPLVLKFTVPDLIANSTSVLHSVVF